MDIENLANFNLHNDSIKKIEAPENLKRLEFLRIGNNPIEIEIIKKLKGINNNYYTAYAKKFI